MKSSKSKKVTKKKYDVPRVQYRTHVLAFLSFSVKKIYHLITHMDYVGFIFFLWSIGIYLSRWIPCYNRIITIDPFDGAIRLLTGLYASMAHFKVYNDFGYVYPPGLILVYQIFRLNYTSNYHFLSLAFLALTIMIVSFVYFKTRSFFFSGIYVLLLTWPFLVTNDPFTDIVWVIFATLLLFYLKEGDKRYTWFIVAAGVIDFWFKWEKITILFMLSVAAYVILLIIRANVKELLRTVKLLGITVGLGFLTLLIYFWVESINVFNAFYFIFIYEVKIGAYRQIINSPLDLVKYGTFTINNLLYLSFFLLGVVFITIFIHKIYDKKMPIYLYLILLPLSQVPYALVRSEWGHQTPFFFTLLVVLIFYCFMEKKIQAILIVPVIYFIICWGLFVINGLDFSYLKNPPYTKPLNELLQDCKNQVTQDYKTIFVGRTDYSHYRFNDARLYLINIYAKPATKYIYDDPGIQSSCYDGARITEDLTNSQKPMLAFIDPHPGDQGSDPNPAAENMTSCGKIEKWLATHPYKTLGICLNNEFEVRLYK